MVLQGGIEHSLVVIHPANGHHQLSASSSAFLCQPLLSCYGCQLLPLL
jgi:hypothetical protein